MSQALTTQHAFVQHRQELAPHCVAVPPRTMEGMAEDMAEDGSEGPYSERGMYDDVFFDEEEDGTEEETVETEEDDYDDIVNMADMVGEDMEDMGRSNFV